MWQWAVLTFAFYVSVPCFSYDSSSLPDDLILAKWTRELDDRLYSFLASVMRMKDAQECFSKDKRVGLTKISGKSVMFDTMKKMGALLDRKRKALQRLVDEAERSVVYLDRTYGVMLDLEDVSFFNMKDPPVNASLTFSPRLRQRVSFEQSGVHIPLQILDSWMGPRYKESWWHDPEMLNGVNWTSILDDVFKLNWEEDPTLRWQFFGSSHGFMRVYPAFRWPDHPSLPDLFDVRRRTWYVQGSVSSKDMIILIDRSGSVHGQTLDIMKITVRALLNSLGENDYVNVAWFNNQVRWVVPCLNTLVQATAQNRRLLSDAVERLTESNLTSYAAALDFAFEAFKQFDEERKAWSGANCHKAIMFLSDGGTDWPEELVTQHCNQSRTDSIKIFAFACGPHPIPTVVLKQMACSTGGYFSPITALGSVRVKVQDYVRVLTRPLATSNERGLFQWHNFYRDVGGLGMMTTLTLPVYSKGQIESADSLLGVMGIDVPVEEMSELFPRHKLSALGYAFSINTNGFVVFHPRLRDHIVYIEDPPDVDLTDLEGTTTEVEVMRREMVEGKAGELRNFTSLVPVGLGHAIRVQVDYFYDAVQSSTFRFGIAIPTDADFLNFANFDDFETSLKLLETLDGVLIAPWRVCPFVDATESLSALELAQRIRNNFSVCDPDLVKHILWDVSRAQEMKSIWKKAVDDGVYSRFLMTSGGVTLVSPAQVTEDYLRQRDPYRNNLYKWASRIKTCVMSVARGRSYDLTVACRLMFSSSLAGVAGVEMERTLIQNVFENVTRSEESLSCKDSTALHCYLLNDGGIIITTNQYEVRAGGFIGEHDSQILKILLESGILGREYRFNYQSWCSKGVYQIQTVSAANKLYLLNTLYQSVMSMNLGFLYNYFVYFISSFSLYKSVIAGEMPSEVSNHSCVTRSSWFYQQQPEFQPRREKFWCLSTSGACEREMHISHIPEFSLIFVVATPQCLCSQPVPLEFVDPQDVGPDHCHMKESFRIRPEKCFVEKSRPSNETDCGDSSSAATIHNFLLQHFLSFLIFSLVIH